MRLPATGGLTLDQTTRAIVCKATAVPAVIDMELRVQGPSAPSWTRGLRKATGPGPRDTYG